MKTIIDMIGSIIFYTIITIIVLLTAVFLVRQLPMPEPQQTTLMAQESETLISDNYGYEITININDPEIKDSNYNFFLGGWDDPEVERFSLNLETKDPYIITHINLISGNENISFFEQDDWTNIYKETINDFEIAMSGDLEFEIVFAYGEDEQLQQAYDEGYDAGYDDGHQDGYDAGYDDGANFEFTTWFRSILSAVSIILSIELLTGITLGTILFVPLMFGLFWFFIKMVTGVGGR